VIDVDETLEALLGAAQGMAVRLADLGGPTAPGGRLRDSVVRPLLKLQQSRRRAAAAPSDAPGDCVGQLTCSSTSAEEGLWQLALSATGLMGRDPAPEIAEAAAALQDLVLAAVDEATTAGRVAVLEALQTGLVPGIVVSPDGPYLVTNARSLTTWLGDAIDVRPQIALCRCGNSAIKPWCDGTHATIGFTDAKDPKRVADRRDSYVGQQVTVLDNRGLCQHSGFCTDRLATVFRTGAEPFVAPSGGRMDEIIRAVRDCPSGALSYAIDGVDACADVDHHGTRPPNIEVSRDGPYRVSGAIPLTGAGGAEVERNAGASREHYALCRCGHSQNKPFCSGMHYYVSFRDPVAPADHDPTVFEWIGGMPALLRMTRLFYEKHIPQDPLLAPLFANMAADHPERVAAWLGEVFGGPKRYSEGYGGYTRMISQHVGKGITEQQRARWVELLVTAAREAGLPNDAEFRSVFGSYIEWGTRLAFENSQANAHPPEHMPMPHWDWNTASGPPGSRVSALAPVDEADEGEVALPPADAPLSFVEHIKGLFRRGDRQSMLFAFDLWSYDDVSRHADAISERLQAGTMPCDGAWPEAKIDVFRRWINTGKPA
jgi:CDGSH-type Zn-finger protein/truncated hemoglobin YjbI